MIAIINGAIGAWSDERPGAMYRIVVINERMSGRPPTRRRRVLDYGCIIVVALPSYTQHDIDRLRWSVSRLRKVHRAYRRA